MMPDAAIKAVKCMVPIAQQDGARVFDHFGTSVLLAIEGRQFLISAAHVVLGKNLSIFSASGNIPLGFIPFSTTSPDLPSALSDSTDVAFAVLPEDIAELLNASGYEPWPLKDTAYVYRPSNDRVAFSGYPCTKADYQVPLQRMKLQPGFFVGRLLSEEELVNRGLEPDVHISQRYQREKQVDMLTQKQITGPEPQGISGGPVWRWGADGGLWLAGVGFKFDAANELFIGTRIDHVFALIQQQSIEDWIARRKTPVTVLSFNPETGKIEEEIRGPKPEQGGENS